ncbi:hypothetical protein FFZ77_30310 [Streptomyces katsurahamanus]|uniref:Uncharacterized protein n=1 Tax=Streptomyces katsurahamanus TaxID=2577098 RepID=A0ABW9P2A8_9ACTN|nr:hypothetical protein [Streptomyces katsurahamanus]
MFRSSTCRAASGPDSPRRVCSRISALRFQTARSFIPVVVQSSSSSRTAPPEARSSPGSLSIMGSKWVSRQAASR